VLWVVLALNITVSIMKLVMGYAMSSASVIADGFHSFSDGSSNVLGLIGTTIAAKPADKEHPYGHKKFETLTALGITAMLFMVSVNIIKNGIDKLQNPSVPQVDWFGIGVMIFTIAVNIFVVVYETREGKRLHSDVLVSDALHTKSDILVSFSVLLSLLFVRWGFPFLDPIMSFVIALVIIKAAIEIFINASRVLCDATVVDPESIIEVVSKIDGVLDCHKVRTRGREDDITTDFHIIVDSEMTVEQYHNLYHNISEKIARAFPGMKNVYIHIEPYRERQSDISYIS
jgi:cation diffusion facilitator family transporter